MSTRAKTKTGAPVGRLYSTQQVPDVKQISALVQLAAFWIGITSSWNVYK